MYILTDFVEFLRTCITQYNSRWLLRFECFSLDYDLYQLFAMFAEYLQENL